jgi:multidrug efflux pump subunit AcrA (membrane-fusion protein)
MLTLLTLSVIVVNMQLGARALIGAAGVLVGALLTLGCHRGEVYVRALPPVRVRMVVAPGPAGAVRYSGRVAAETEVTLSFKVEGYITAIAQAKRPDGTGRAIQAGDPVSRSAVLAAIRRSD